MKPRVLIFLATYCGEKYLREQLDSLFAQKDVDIFIKCCDDCSDDSTVNILEEYKMIHSNFDYEINKKNKKFTYNFLDLMFSEKNSDFDYYAFCDQDDVWMDNKLISAIRTIESKNNKKDCKNGILYCSNLTIVDENLNYIGMMENKSACKLNKYNYLVSNLCTGCTCVMDKKFYKHVTKKYPQNIYLHDYWIFLVAVFTADYIYDINSYIYYRQHGNNQIGSNKKFFTKDKIKKFLRPKHLTSSLIKEFLVNYNDDIYADDFKYVYIAANYSNSFIEKNKLFWSLRIRRRKFNILFKLKVLFNKY